VTPRLLATLKKSPRAEYVRSIGGIQARRRGRTLGRGERFPASRPAGAGTYAWAGTSHKMARRDVSPPSCTRQFTRMIGPGAAYDAATGMRRDEKDLEKIKLRVRVPQAEDAQEDED
jgi:hypothetical protein